jgi:hypothetical protein
VPRDTPGLTIARCNETLGCRFMNNGELVFEDMCVPEDHLLVEGDALGKAAVYFRPGKIIQAAKNLGVGVRAFEVTSDYVQNYVQGGRILIKHQAVALRLADMATRIEAVRRYLHRASRAVDDNAPDADTLCNMAKVFASEEIMKVAQHALELAWRQRHDARFRRRKAFPRRRDLSAHGRHRRHLEAQDREIDVSAHRRQICRAGVINSLRQTETDRPRWHKPDELRICWALAERRCADQQRERRHQRRKQRGAAGAEQDHGAGEKIDRAGAGETAPCTTACIRFSNNPAARKLSKSNSRSGRPASDKHAGDRRGPHRRNAPQPQQHAENRKGAAGGDKQQVAEQSLRAHGVQRLDADHDQPGNHHQRASNAARRQDFLENKARQHQAAERRARRLNDAPWPSGT